MDIAQALSDFEEAEKALESAKAKLREELKKASDEIIRKLYSKDLPGTNALLAEIALLGKIKKASDLVSAFKKGALELINLLKQKAISPAEAANYFKQNYAPFLDRIATEI